MDVNDIKFTVEYYPRGSTCRVLMAEVCGRRGVCCEGGFINFDNSHGKITCRDMADYPIDSDLDVVHAELTEYFTKAKECWIIDYNARIAKDKDIADFLAKVAELKIEV